jgi:radical SAM superfamily enzyme YgiQ (UPF0313 family)
MSADVLLIEDLSQQRLPARALAAVLRHAGLRAQLVNFATDQDADAIVALAVYEQPHLIIVSLLFAHRVREHLALIAALREHDVRAHITLTGYLPHFAHAELLAACPSLDSVLRGEAETRVVELARTIIAPYPHPSPLPHRERGTPSPLWGEGRGEGLNLDDTPFPARDDGIASHQGYGFATIESSRGCYHACTFCLPCAFYRDLGARYRLRSVTNVVDEIEALYRQGARLFLFDDEQFLSAGHARTERVTALGDELARRRLQIAFTIKCRADDVDAALFRRLKEMGLLRVYIGIESGCQQSLDLFGKRVTVQQNADALAALDALDIVADFRALLFHPWSTLEAIQADIAFLQSVMPHISTAFNFREIEIYPGTPLAERLRAEGHDHHDSLPIGYILADSRAELSRRLCRVVFSPHGCYARVQDALTQAWFDLLLQQRFQPTSSYADHAHELKATAARVNSASLDVWRDMLAFADAGDIHDAEQVNARACAWTSRVNAVCVRQV